MKRHSRTRWSALLLALTLALPTAPAPARAGKEAPKAPRIAPLKILESLTIPTTEISGIAWRTSPESKRRELLLVSDRAHQLFVLDWENRAKPGAVRAFPIPEDPASAGAQSEWESVFSDDTGRVFIIRESPPQILVVSADLKSVESKIDLKIAWPPGHNSGAEGLLPLSNGHILIVKEKEPLQVIEFAPAGAKSEGYRESLAIEKKGRFPLPKPPEAALSPAFTWQFAPEAEQLFEDSSGINVGLDGSLYLLGDQRNLIGRIGRKLQARKERIPLQRLWSVPSEIKRPEGLVLDEKNRAIVAIDSKKTDQPNLFVLSPLE